MDRQEFEDAARRYREELFRLYAARQIDPPPKPVQAQPVIAVQNGSPQNGVTQNLPPQPAPPQAAALPVSDHLLPPGIGENAPDNATENLPVPGSPGADYPPPDSEYPPENPPENSQETPPAFTQEGLPDMPDDSAVKPEADGGILVHVRTAKGSRPVPGATVLITQQTVDLPVLVAVLLTDACGDTEEIRVPAPPSTADQQYPAYAQYDITVHAEGYYRENSADVPVFEGVVSVQSFDLIPLPAGQTEGFTGAQTFYNNMPRP